jgi:hypothetical protein
VPSVQDDEGGFEGEGGFLEGGDDYGGGGFEIDSGAGGGFLPDEEEGGFIAEAGEDGEDGGYIEDEPATQHVDPESSDRIPLSVLPRLLISLKLPADDDVLAVFRASATGWGEPGDEDEGRRKRGPAGEDEEGGVLLKDFRAVCAALMDPEDEDGGGMDVDAESDSSAEEDAFKLDDEDGSSDLSDLSEESYGATTKGRKPTRRKKVSSPTDKETSRVKGKGKGKSKGKDLEARSGDKVRLNSKQKESAKTIWDMLKPPGKPEGRGKSGNVLGRDEVRALVRSLGEMWTEDEVSCPGCRKYRLMVTVCSPMYRLLIWSRYSRASMKDGG